MCGEDFTHVAAERIVVLGVEAAGVPRGHAECGFGIGEGLWRDPPVVVRKGKDIQWWGVDQPDPVHVKQGWRGLGATGALGATRRGASALSLARHWMLHSEFIDWYMGAGDVECLEGADVFRDQALLLAPVLIVLFLSSVVRVDTRAVEPHAY